jgi:DivIVA domain-containing protein
MTTELAQEFAVTVRGYDRAQVDSYVDTLREWLGNATVRMETAEADSARMREQVVQLRTRLAHLEEQVAENPPRTIAALGDRVEMILRLAEEGATAAQGDAEAEAVAIIGRARQEADDLIRSAHARQAEMDALAGATGLRAATVISQAEVRAAGTARRILAEAEMRASTLDAESSERAKLALAEAEVQRDRVLAELADEKLAIACELRRLTAERDEVRDGLTRLKESLHRTISELPAGAGDALVAASA